MLELIGAIVGIAGIVLAYVLGGKNQNKVNQLTIQKLERELQETNIKLNFIDRIMDLEFINQIGEAVNEMFENTKADRFLILVAKNGKTDFNVVNVVFEQHKRTEYRINAIARYRNVHVDNAYREMLKEVELKGVVQMETATMPKGVLRTFYEMENVTFSKVRHLARKPIDDGNDFLVYSSVSTHEKEDFTPHELMFTKTIFEGIIIPGIDKMLD